MTMELSNAFIETRATFSCLSFRIYKLVGRYADCCATLFPGVLLTTYF